MTATPSCSSLAFDARLGEDATVVVMHLLTMVPRLDRTKKPLPRHHVETG